MSPTALIDAARPGALSLVFFHTKVPFITLEAFGMDAALTWLDLTASDRDKMRQVLDMFKEQGTIDEMGLGTLRDAFSDALFPGTSTIQTRLRYVLFIPWIYRQLETSSNNIDDDVATYARDAELGLIHPLQLSSDPDGTIGVRAGGSLARLPSSVYWTALVRWGIFQHEQSQGWYHTHFARLRHRHDTDLAADDPGVVDTHRPNWHLRLPDRPKSFPENVSFALTGEEAEFLRGRIEERCAGTLLAWLVREGTDAPPDGCFWQDSAAFDATSEIRRTVELARRFSLHVEGMPLLYNLLLAERLHAEHGGDGELAEQYRLDLAEWATREAEDGTYNPDALWRFVASRGTYPPRSQRHFVEHWSRRIVEVAPVAAPDDTYLRTLIEGRERQLKGRRARLVNTGRLLDWNGAVGVGRMNFRWHRVRQLLLDLHQGLAA